MNAENPQIPKWSEELPDSNSWSGPVPTLQSFVLQICS